MSTIPNIYYIKKSDDVTFDDITTKFAGLTILKIDSFNKRGKAKNIYTASWINSNSEDVYIPDTIYFENPDIDITFIIRDTDNHALDVRLAHELFINFMMNNKVTIRSLYANKQADFVCLSDYSPTTEVLGRPDGMNRILGTITLHRIGEAYDV